MPISKDQMAHFDPAIKSIRVKDKHINLTLEQNTVILTFNEQELHWMMQLLQETKSGL